MSFLRSLFNSEENLCKKSFNLFVSKCITNEEGENLKDFREDVYQKCKNISSKSNPQTISKHIQDKYGFALSKKRLLTLARTKQEIEEKYGSYSDPNILKGLANQNYISNKQCLKKFFPEEIFDSNPCYVDENTTAPQLFECEEAGKNMRTLMSREKM